MFVNVNQMTGMPVSDSTMEKGQKAADVIGNLSASEAQVVAQELGFLRTKIIVSEMLYGLLPEEAVAVAMDSLQAEFDRMSEAKSASCESTLFL